MTARGSFFRVEGVVAGGVVVGGAVAEGVVVGAAMTGGAVTGRMTGADGSDGLRVGGVAAAVGGRSLARPLGPPLGRYGATVACGAACTGG
ncbi:MAG: hypothetical protein ABIQ16_12445 [Polyangiaceae bacterium]